LSFQELDVDSTFSSLIEASYIYLVLSLEGASGSFKLVGDVSGTVSPGVVNMVLLELIVTSLIPVRFCDMRNAESTSTETID
jgi:hypothetical protein